MVNYHQIGVLSPSYFFFVYVCAKCKSLFLNTTRLVWSWLVEERQSTSLALGLSNLTKCFSILFPLPPPIPSSLSMVHSCCQVCSNPDNYSLWYFAEALVCVFQAPPDLVTSEQRHEAEQVFLQLRNTKNPFNLCRQLLGEWWLCDYFFLSVSLYSILETLWKVPHLQ